MIGPLAYLGCVVAGAVASGVNTVAGGGSLISFPYLTAGVGLPSVPANATNSVGLWPGSLAGALGFRDMFSRTGAQLKRLIWPTLLGSQLGAILLLETPSSLFDYLVPALIVLAAGLLIFGKKLTAAARGRHIPPWVGLLLQLLVSIYGGYFGAGMGIMMLAAFSLYVEGTLHELNAIKNVLGLVINFTCSITFLVKGLVDPKLALALVVGSVLGGYAAARLSLRADPDRLRFAIAIYGFFAAGYFLWVALNKH
jgi:uncharacterized membrane protein YfcA